MKIISMAAMFLMISGWAAAGSLEPPSGPAPTMKSLQDIYDKVAIGTEITSVPYQITSSGFYYFTKNLNSPNQTGITITANNVTLDLMGFTLSGPILAGGDHHGIYMNGRSNVEIRNGTVRSFPNYAIFESGNDGKGHRIINIRAVGNGEGIILRSRGNLVKECTAASNRYGGIYAASGSTVIENIVYDNFQGISTGSASTVMGNTASGNRFAGIFTADGSTVTGNIAYGNSYAGIIAYHGSTVTGNTAYENGENGITAYVGTITGNTVYNNSNNGISSSGKSTVIGNSAYQNGNDGIYLGVSGSTVTSNTAHDNGRHGILSGSGSAVIGNTATHNQNYGILLGGYNLVDQNMVIDNVAGNMNPCPSCVFGTNLSP